MKTIRFSKPRYVGDPINAVRIFNEKQVDELVLLDIDASKEQREPEYQLIEDIAAEAFMPIAYGGGIKNVDEASRLVNLGAEKTVINTAALRGLDVIESISERLGSQSVVISVNAKKKRREGYRVFDSTIRRTTTYYVAQHVKDAVEAGAGEVFVNDVRRDGTFEGFDLDLIRAVSGAVDVPVIASGGAGQLEDFRFAVDAGASAVAAGSMFVYIGKHRAVMINYPTDDAVREILGSE